MEKDNFLSMQVAVRWGHDMNQLAKSRPTVESNTYSNLLQIKDCFFLPVKTIKIQANMLYYYRI